MAKATKQQEKNGLDNDIARALSILNKSFGPGSLLTFDNLTTQDVESISTGSLNLDLALGVGGLPLGRISTIYGEPSSGKTTIALQLCAEAQKKGYLVAYIDSEHAMDVHYAKALGIDLKRLLLSQPDSGTDCFKIAEQLLKETNVKLIIFDSVTTMLTDSEINGEMGQNFIGRQAKMVSDGVKRLTPLLAKSNTACFFISQTRKNIGQQFGDNDIMSGGTSLMFYSSLIMKIWKKQAPNIEKINGEELATSVEATVKVVKNKVAPPFRVAKFLIKYGKGVSKADEIFDLAVKFGLLQKEGSWIKYKGKSIAQGKSNAVEWLNSDSERMSHFQDTIQQYIMSKRDVTFEFSSSDDSQEEVQYDPETGEILE